MKDRAHKRMTKGFSARGALQAESSCGRSERGGGEGVNPREKQQVEGGRLDPSGRRCEGRN